MPFPLGFSLDDVLLIPQRSEVESRTQVDLTTEIAPNFFLKIPLIATKMETITSVEMAIAMSENGGLALMHRFDTAIGEAEKIAKVKKSGHRIFATVGARDDYINRAELCLKAGADGLVFDVAHGHLVKALTAVSEIKNRFPKFPLLAGIVSTYEGAYDIFTAGADTAMVGVGAGSICTTRIVTGCGVPLLTSLLEAKRAAKKFKKKFILPDAGIKNSGDVVKALAAGASACVCGFFLAGMDESPGTIVEKNGKFFKSYNGSTSLAQKRSEKLKTGVNHAHFEHHIEGVEGLVPYRGPLADYLKIATAGIRSGLSYCGAQNIPELWKKAKFIQITAAGMRESGAHDVEPV